jgi:hypothetical protein
LSLGLLRLRGGCRESSDRQREGSDCEEFRHARVREQAAHQADGTLATLRRAKSRLIFAKAPRERGAGHASCVGRRSKVTGMWMSCVPSERAFSDNRRGKRAPSDAIVPAGSILTNVFHRSTGPRGPQGPLVQEVHGICLRAEPRGPIRSVDRVDPVDRVDQWTRWT